MIKNKIKVSAIFKSIVTYEFLMIFIISIIPLFSTFPYRVNIFLSWEGAYRLYLGQVPFKDFFLPMGYMYWVIPALFFKIFGPYLITLIKAQVFMNVMGVLFFREILKSFKVASEIRFLSVALFLISFSFFNFWPWYNHSVIIYQIIGLALIVRFIHMPNKGFKPYLILFGGALFLFISFFTKQDGGGLGFLIAVFLLLYQAIIEKRYLDLIIFLALYGVVAMAFILPVYSEEFTYWFNLGQEPHNSRFHLWDIITLAFNQSKWEKFYIAILIIIFLSNLRRGFEYFTSKSEFTFFLFTLGILVEALIFQVTSYTPPDNNIFFHAFSFAFIAQQLFTPYFFKRKVNIIISLILVFFWWSGTYFKYVERKINRMFPELTVEDEDKVGINTYTQGTGDTSNVLMQQWEFTNLESFQGIYMPKSTVEGMSKALDLGLHTKENFQFLNMTELTPLNYELGIIPEKNKPLWHHKGVGLFQREVDEYCKEIENGKYDMVMFEVIPYLNNFFPEEVRACLIDHYQLEFTFLAPRRPTDSIIEVYVKRE